MLHAAELSIAKRVSGSCPVRLSVGGVLLANAAVSLPGRCLRSGPRLLVAARRAACPVLRALHVGPR